MRGLAGGRGAGPGWKAAGLNHIPRYVLGSIAGLLLWFLLTSHSDAPAIWAHGVESQLAAHRSWLARSTALQQAAERAQAHAIALQSALAHDRRVLDSLGGVVEAVPTDTMAVHAFVRQCALTLARCQERGDAWKLVADSQGQRADLSERRLSVADSLLRIGLKVSTCRILWVPCATRSQTLVLGLVGGVLLGRAVK